MAKNICSGTPFINVTFTELLWGYYDSMPCVNLNRPSDCPAPPEEVFTLITIITVLIITITTILIVITTILIIITILIITITTILIIITTIMITITTILIIITTAVAMISIIIIDVYPSGDDGYRL